MLDQFIHQPQFPQRALLALGFVTACVLPDGVLGTSVLLAGAFALTLAVVHYFEWTATGDAEQLRIAKRAALLCGLSLVAVASFGTLAQNIGFEVLRRIGVGVLFAAGAALIGLRSFPALRASRRA